MHINKERRVDDIISNDFLDTFFLILEMVDLK